MNKIRLSRNEIIITASVAIILILFIIFTYISKVRTSTNPLGDEISKIQTQSASDDINSIESDLNTTDVNNLDIELNEIEKELNSSL